MTALPGKAAYQAVLFDLDGTLLDTAPDFVTAINRMVRESGREIMDPALIRAGVTNGSAGLITLAFGLSPMDEEFEPLRQRFLTYYAACLTENTRLFPGLDDVLTKLDAHGIPWGVVTNKPALYTFAILDNLPLPSRPGAVVCPDHVTHTKPHPEPVLLACSQLAVAPEHTLFVGDHLRDIESGHNAGCATVSAAWGYIDADEDPAAWGAHFLIEHASELDGILFSR